MKNATITLEDEVAQWARIQAAQQNTSGSQMLGKLLRKHMLEEEGYSAAMQQFLDRAPTRLKEEGEAYPERDSLHER